MFLRWSGRIDQWSDIHRLSINEPHSSEWISEPKMAETNIPTGCGMHPEFHQIAQISTWIFKQLSTSVGRTHFSEIQNVRTSIDCNGIRPEFQLIGPFSSRIPPFSRSHIDPIGRLSSNFIRHVRRSTDRSITAWSNDYNFVTKLEQTSGDVRNVRIQQKKRGNKILISNFTIHLSSRLATCAGGLVTKKIRQG